MKVMKVLLFAAILVGHWLMQFLTWSYAMRSAPARLLWNMLSTPLLHLNGSIANQHFWALLTLNSVLWAATLTYILSKFVLKH
jgi:hypothetical protein